MRLIRSLLALWALAVAAPCLLAAPPAITPQPFVSGLSNPVEIAHANDGSGRLFVVEQDGVIRVIQNGVLLFNPFLDIRDKVLSGGERGLLGLAFHPAYVDNGRFYVFYTRPLAGDTGSELVIERYNVTSFDANLGDRSTGSIVLTIPHPQQANHNGGHLAFGPDGFLYAGVGDGGGGGDPPGNAQSLAVLLGKMLRIEVDGAQGYSVPRSNPLVANASARPEIWDFGLRNPWRFSFDMATNDLLIGDVGQDAREEIDFEPFRSGGGRNYGWNVFEGTACFKPPTGCSLTGHVPPVLEYAHDANGGISVTGGYRYRGRGLPALQGYYLYADFGSGRLWAASPDSAGHWTTTQVGTVTNPSTFGEDEYGELYVADYAAGQILRLTPATVPASSGSTATRYRLYNPQTREHLLTTGIAEYNTLPVCCGWQQEGPAHVVLSGPGSVGGVDAVPNYRLYNPTTHQHHWTLEPVEYAFLATVGWQQEGIDGYMFRTRASGTVPLYRMYINAFGGLHLWTTDANERHTLVAGFGWEDEGIAGYVLPLP